MNKLEKIKLKLSEKVYKDNFYNQDEDLLYVGFDAAIALQLPVKFAEWLAINGIKVDGKDSNGSITWMKYVNASHTNQGNTQQLYDYYINNIYNLKEDESLK